MFGQIARRYDLLNHLLSLNIDKRWRNQTVRAVPPGGDGPILDLCTGTGDLALAYYRATDERTPVVGADFCHEMLAISKEKGRRTAVNGRLSFIEADAQRLPFPDDYFQIVSVAFGLRNVTDTLRGLQEMIRVCRPGGRIAILEFSMPRRQPFRGIYRWYFRHVLPRIGQLLARNRESAYNYLPASVSEFPDGEAMENCLRAAGLQNVWSRPLTFGVATLYVGCK
jgi:demethylmenaquinone methyltransferase/2-methoxy-6-polyprenyl-1,4-benzoquinol methylase